ncbi:terminase family protein [Stakelama sp. CBK3Z-3]|uniref:Terminase family protein n=1 Tax=Stakelama flava TaxID=2860338 RepID=A0ABS6XK56_9SPHN|nr:terminase family protein [Stakelama flava]MBW4330590.1 terminase family protein [Stakelama flava]
MSARARDVASGDARRRFDRGERDYRILLSSWEFWAEAKQLPPPGEWRTWLMLAGRGFGKTRAGAEWVRALAEADPTARIALVGATMGEVRSVMIEGESGILASIASDAEMPTYEVSRGRLVWKNGAQAFVHSGERPDGLRGPQFSAAWCDEIAKWAYPRATWDNLAMCMRVGNDPRVLVTTTPRPIPLLRDLAARDDVAVVRGRTRDNAMLPGAFVAAVEAAYGGTRLGRQELDGELIDDVAGALWRRDLLEAIRVASRPALRRVVVGVDPPAGSKGDACGIVAVALARDGKAYVLEDASVAGASPEGWARAVAACAVRNGADRVVAEANNGGEMVRAVLVAADAALPVRLVHASRGKVARAEPVAALYEGGKVAHVGAFPALEDEMCGLVSGGGYEGPGRSPDRADALVWAMSELMLKRRGQAAVRVLG